MFAFKKKLEMPSAAEALPGRPTPIPTARDHFIFHRPLKGPYPQGFERAMFGTVCATLCVEPCRYSLSLRQ